MLVLSVLLDLAADSALCQKQHACLVTADRSFKRARKDTGSQANHHLTTVITYSTSDTMVHL